MSRVGGLLSNPHFFRHARTRLLEAGREGEAITQAIVQAECQISEGRDPKKVAFDLMLDHPAIPLLSAMAELSAPEKGYLFSVLSTPADTQEAVSGLIAALWWAETVREGIYQSHQSLGDLVHKWKSSND